MSRLHRRIEKATRLLFGTYRPLSTAPEDITQTWLLVAPARPGYAFSVVIGGRWGVYIARMPQNDPCAPISGPQSPSRVSVDVREGESA